MKLTFILTWSANWVIISTNVTNQGAKFSTTDAKLYVPVVALSTQDNAKLLEQLNQVLKIQLTGINISQKYQQKHEISI